MHFLISTTVIGLIVLGVILLGGLLFVLSGLMYIKKGYEAIIEKVDKFHCVYGQGLHYLPPLSYHRVGLYKITPKCQVLEIMRKKVEFYYQIYDVILFHYSGHNVKLLFKEAEALETLDECANFLKNELPKIGVRLLKKGEIKRNVFE